MSAATLIVRTNRYVGAAEAGELLKVTRVLERLSDRLSAALPRLETSFDCTEALAMYFATRDGRASPEQTEEAILAEYMRTWLILGHSHVRPIVDREHIESALERLSR